jgi:hypothetical protein
MDYSTNYLLHNYYTALQVQKTMNIVSNTYTDKPGELIITFSYRLTLLPAKIHFRYCLFGSVFFCFRFPVFQVMFKES